MKPPDVKRPRKRGGATEGGKAGQLGRRADVDSTAARPWRVVVIGVDRAREWSRYSGRDEAERVVAQLRRHGLDARLHIDEPPEHRGDRRRFLVWALMLDLIPTQRVVERIVAEVTAELRDG